MEDISRDDLSKTNQSTTAKPKEKKLSSDCKICAAPALYSYFSVVVCDSCKIFFRRYAQTEPGRFIGVYVDPCEINVQPEQLATLTADKWTILSNITHCYDEYNKCAAAESFMQKQNELPFKMRFRAAIVIDFYKSLMIEGQYLYEKNVDFVSLLPHDRSILLHTTVKYVVAIASCLIGRAAHVLDNPAFYKYDETSMDRLYYPLLFVYLI